MTAMETTAAGGGVRAETAAEGHITEGEHAAVLGDQQIAAPRWGLATIPDTGRLRGIPPREPWKRALKLNTPPSEATSQ